MLPGVSIVVCARTATTPAPTPCTASSRRPTSSSSTTASRTSPSTATSTSWPSPPPTPSPAAAWPPAAGCASPWRRRSAPTRCCSPGAASTTRATWASSWRRRSRPYGFAGPGFASRTVRAEEPRLPARRQDPPGSRAIVGLRHRPPAALPRHRPPASASRSPSTSTFPDHHAYPPASLEKIGDAFCAQRRRAGADHRQRPGQAPGAPGAAAGRGADPRRAGGGVLRLARRPAGGDRKVGRAMAPVAPSPLPIDEVLPEVVSALRDGGAVVLRAPTGAGKTTRVPPALLAAGIAGKGQIVMLEPRRLAARAAARRMAEEQGWRLGGEIGYHIRFDRQAGPETRILVVTEGILVQMLQRDPFLEGVGAVVFDEFHERNLHSDLALAMVRRVQREVRDDLEIVVMSATLEPAPIAAYLGGCRRSSRARAGSTRSRSATSNEPTTGGRSTGASRRASAGLWQKPWRRPRLPARCGGDPPHRGAAGDLGGPGRPGADPLRRPAGRAAGRGADAAGTGARWCSPPTSPRPRSPSTGSARWSTAASPGDALRPGGAGSTAWSSAASPAPPPTSARAAPDARVRGSACGCGPRHDDLSLADDETPEIRRVDLAAPALQLLAWGETDLAAFDWFEAPDPAALERALELLADLGAVRGRRRAPRGHRARPGDGAAAGPPAPGAAAGRRPPRRGAAALGDPGGAGRRARRGLADGGPAGRGVGRRGLGSPRPPGSGREGRGSRRRRDGPRPGPPRPRPSGAAGRRPAHPPRQAPSRPIGGGPATTRPCCARCSPPIPTASPAGASRERRAG